MITRYLQGFPRGSAGRVAQLRALQVIAAVMLVSFSCVTMAGVLSKLSEGSVVEGVAIGCCGLVLNAIPLSMFSFAAVWVEGLRLSWARGLATRTVDLTSVTRIARVGPKHGAIFWLEIRDGAQVVQFVTVLPRTLSHQE